MKKTLFLAGVVFLLSVSAVYANSEIDNFFYDADGNPLFVPLADSLVFILHNETYPGGGTAFIQLAGILDDEYMLLESAGDAFVYELANGYPLAVALTQLREMPEVEIANPVIVYNDDPPFAEYLTDEFIARFHYGIEQTVIDSINEFYHVEIVMVDPDFPSQYLLRMTGPTDADVLQISRAYYESGLCLYAQPNIMSPPLPMGVPNDTYFDEQWSMYNTGQAGGIVGCDIDAERAWEISEGDDMPVVAVIDFGFQLDHEDLDGVHIWWPYDAAGDDLDNYEPDTDPSYFCTTPSPYCWHGTAMAGIISARMNNALGLAGVAPGCRLTPIKFCDNSGFSNDWSKCGAFRHTRQFHPKVNIASCSWFMTQPRPAVEAALDSTYNHGVLILFAAGNKGVMEYPASSPWVTAVGATTNRDSVWSDSTGASGQGEALDLVAPGANLPVLDLMGAAGYSPTLGSCGGNSNYACGISGSSISCAEAAATAGLVLSRRYDLVDGKYFAPQDSLRRILYDSAEDEINPADPPGWDEAYGHGRLNAYRALLAVIRGDVNNSGTIDPVDVVTLINCVYKNQCYLQPEYCVGDCDCNGTVNPVDVVALVNHVYKDLPIPPICTDFSAQHPGSGAQ